MTSFLIADSFTDSLAHLTGDEQKAVKTTAFDLQLNPAHPGMQFHRLDKAKDKRFWSVRVNADIRIIVHRSEASLLLCYVDHHDKAYDWAERRKLETHPATGAAQFVEMPTMYVPARDWTSSPVAAYPKSGLFVNVSEQELLSYGVPPEWIGPVRAANEDSFFEIVSHLPVEAGEALIELAVGGKPKPRPKLAASADAVAHPDARRRFQPIKDRAGLENALARPALGSAKPAIERPALSLARFETFWGALRTSLRSGTGLRGWGAVRGFTSMRFQVDDVDAGSVTVSSPTMSAPRRIGKSEFAKLYALWNDYCDGMISRADVTPISQNSSYIFAILRWHEDFDNKLS